jgi:hypothetical protein
MMNTSKWITTCSLVALALNVAHAETIKASAEPVTVALSDGSEVSLSANYDVHLKVQEPLAPPTRQIALFVRNNLRNAKTLVFESEAFKSQVAAYLSNGALEIMDVDDVVETIIPSKTTQDFLSQTSRTQLARNLGVDYLLVVSLDNFNQADKKLRDSRLGSALDADGTTLKTTTKRLSASYRVLDATTGTSIGGGVVKSTLTKFTSAGLEQSDTSPLEGMEEDLAETLAQKLTAEAPSWRAALADAVGVPVTFSVMAYDMNNQPIYLPSYNPEKAILREVQPAQLNATVEIDGIAMGSANTPISVTKGFHNVRISYPGYEPVTLRIAPRDEMVVSINLQMTDAEYNRIKDSINFMHTLTQEREYNQAELKVLEGHAQRLQQSGLRFDIKELPEQMIELRDLL